jgi:hypothetical protein
MTARDLLEYANIAQIALSVAALAFIGRAGVVRKFSSLVLFLCVDLMGGIISTPILFFRKYTGISLPIAYRIYFYTHWTMFVLDTVLMLAILYSVYELAMRPLVGLHRIGRIVFRWIAAVSLMISVCLSIGPHLLLSSGNARADLFTMVTGRIQEGTSILSLCLLLFVCFATKPLGLTYRSRIFGTTLGLGVIATVQLVLSAWYAVSEARSVYSPIYLVSTLGFCVALSIWGWYFARPEPAREMVLLPTTSPYFLWNRISEALGDAPGNVLLNFKPEMLAPAEVESITSMSRSARERAAARATASSPDAEQELLAR